MNENFKILGETNKYLLGHIYEHAFIIDKETNEKFQIGSLYGDPSCGLIDIENNWCIVGGATIFIWTKSEISELTTDDLYWACKIRQTGQNTVQILIDPWADNSSIWELDLLDKSYFKIRDFNEYNDKENTEQIEW